MQVPLLDLKAQYATIQQPIENAVLEVLRSQCYILGETVKSFEQACANYCRTRYAVGVSSGTDALLIAMMALGIGQGDEVITTPYSFFSTAGSIYRLGARPVFVDIDPDTYNIDPQQIEAAINTKTRAIIPVHLFGQCADMDAITAIARRHNLKIVEDAAQAFGAYYRDQPAGCLGDFGCFSFYPSKNLGGIGDGGLVTTDQPEFYDRLIELRIHGPSKGYYHELVGGNFRLDAIQAAALAVKLGHLEQWNQARAANADDYRRLFRESGLQEKVQPPVVAANCKHIYNQFVVRVKDRDALQKFLASKGIGSAIYYPLGLHRQPCFKDLGYSPDLFPECDNAAANTLSLPIYPESTNEQRSYVVSMIQEFYRNHHQDS